METPEIIIYSLTNVITEYISFIKSDGTFSNNSGLPNPAFTVSLVNFLNGNGYGTHGFTEDELYRIK